MSSRSKGNRNERKAQVELEKEGYLVYRVKGATRFQKNVDMFSIFDIVAKKGHYTKWIQVKTNKKPVLKPYEDFQKNYCSEFESSEVWIHIDRKGWRKILV
jgi:Holliday junction resolvase